MQSITKQDWWLFVGIECASDDCDNILTPEGVKVMQAVDDMVEQDPLWPKLCLLEAGSEKCANDITIGGKVAKASPLDIFKFAYGGDISELTQYAIDIALFGLAYDKRFFDYTIPFFSKDYSRGNRKAKKIRMLIQLAGPIDSYGIRYNNLGDRTAD